MHETKRLLDAAAALSSVLKDKGIPHAFYGSVLRAVVSNSPFSDASRFSSPEIILTNYTPGDFLHSRIKPASAPSVSQSSRSHIRKCRLRCNSFTLDGPVGSTLHVHLLLSLFISFRLHVSYRRPIPSIEASTFVNGLRSDCSYQFRLKYCPLGKQVPVI